jgi:hypothetical protein
MANIHTYIGIENLNLTNNQRNQLVATIQALGAANNSVQPAERNHWRVRPDNDAAIFEALFDEDTITIDSIKQFLANIFGIAVGTINHATQQTQYGLLATFSRNGTDYVRLISFGHDGDWSTWQESNAAVRDYLSDNAVAWGDVDE